MKILNISFIFVYLVAIVLATQDEIDGENTTIIENVIGSTAKTVPVVLNEFSSLSTPKTISSKFINISTISSVQSFEIISINDGPSQHTVPSLPINPLDVKDTPDTILTLTIPSYETILQTIPSYETILQTIPSY